MTSHLEIFSRTSKRKRVSGESHGSKDACKILLHSTTCLTCVYELLWDKHVDARKWVINNLVA